MKTIVFGATGTIGKRAVQQMLDDGHEVTAFARTPDKLGVTRSWVGKVELGERRLDLIEYVRYCKVLEIDPHEGLDLILR